MGINLSTPLYDATKDTHIDWLPHEMKLELLKFISPSDALNMRLMNRSWQHLVDDIQLWFFFYQQFTYTRGKATKMKIQNAVNGKSLDIIKFFIFKGINGISLDNYEYKELILRDVISIHFILFLRDQTYYL